MGKTVTSSAPRSARPATSAGRRTGLDRDDVVAAALDLVVREGAAALSMRRLATLLGVGTPTVYWHVGSRDELVAEVVRLQSERLAAQPVRGTRPRDRVLSAAQHLYRGAIEHRAITSLAHQTGTTSLFLHPLEAALVVELEAAGLEGDACAEAVRSILVVVTGALVLALRDPERVPEPYRPPVLWAGSDDAIAPTTRAALCTDPDLDHVTAATLRTVVDHHVPA